jgi:exopolysaccharide biosynthesis polyprenyl glycosylphosphotransferase
VAADLVAALVVTVAAMMVPHGVSRGVEALLFVPLWLAGVAVTGEYGLPGTLAARLRRLALVATALPTGVLIASEVLRYPLSATTVSAVCGATAVLCGVGRVAAVAATHHGLEVENLTHRAVLVGTGAVLPEVVGRLEQGQHRRFRVRGACIAGGGTPALPGVDIVRGVELCAELVRRCAADTVVLVPDAVIPADEVLRLRWALEEAGVRIFVWTGLSTAPVGRTALDVTDDLALLHLRPPRRLGTSYAVKRVADRLVAALALIVLSPVLLALAVAIRLDSPGPAFFRQRRVGRDDTTFTIWKLRTMSCDAEQALAGLVDHNEASGPLFKVHADPRVTRLGRLLRRTSLDELTQLINVVLGHMSLVGPRPALPNEVDRYPSAVRHRLVVAPGITGLWQVSGRSDLSWEEAVRLDQEYVDSWSIGLDLRIIVRTLRAVVRGTGAY